MNSFGLACFAAGTLSLKSARIVLKPSTERCQVCCWLFRSFSTLYVLRATLFSFSILPFLDKQAELTEECLSKPNNFPMSVSLCVLPRSDTDTSPSRAPRPPVRAASCQAQRRVNSPTNLKNCSRSLSSTNTSPCDSPRFVTW